MTPQDESAACWLVAGFIVALLVASFFVSLLIESANP